jgi:hypothetical protein
MAHNQEALELTQNWIRWSKTRRFFAPPQGKSVLHSLMSPEGAGREPNAFCDPEVAYFHLALTALPESRLVPFLRVYAPELLTPKPVKTYCYYLHIERDTFYKWAHKAAADVVRTTKRMMHDALSAKIGQLRSDNRISPD